MVLSYNRIWRPYKDLLSARKISRYLSYHRTESRYIRPHRPSGQSPTLSLAVDLRTIQDQPVIRYSLLLVIQVDRHSSVEMVYFSKVVLATLPLAGTLVSSQRTRPPPPPPPDGPPGRPRFGDNTGSRPIPYQYVIKVKPVSSLIISSIPNSVPILPPWHDQLHARNIRLIATEFRAAPKP